ncbi:MAG: hypothetical protein C0503_11620 [Gemmatimonas sp.]|nr:hypothetical protein [Gemmatimonas sp.]
MCLAATVLTLAGGLAAGCVDAPILNRYTISSSDSTGILTITLEDSLSAYGRISASDSVILRGAPQDLFGNNPQIVIPLRDGRTLLSDGEVVAAFDSSGNFFGVVMPRGRGPGEVTTLSGLWQSADDSLWMVDPSTRRISRFAPDLKYVRSVEYPRFGENSALSIFGGLDRDTTAVVEFNFSDAPGGPGIMRIEYRVGTWVMGGAAAIGEPRVFGIAQRFAPGVVPAGFSLSPPFSPTAQWRPYGRCMIYGFPERWELSIESPDASGRFTPVTVIRAPLALGDAVTPERKEKHIVDAMAGMPANNSEFPRDQYERALREHVTFPEREPAFGRVLVSDDGAIWVQRYRESAERERDYWTIIDAHGLSAWRFELPTRSRLLAVRPQGAFVATRDADDVETQAWVHLPKLKDIKVVPACRLAP